MSRLVIKNLPKNTNEEDIREIFNEIGTITDIQLKYTPEGKFRRFGFIGYRNDSEGDQAIEKFHNTFIKTSKITVEKCALLGDSQKPKAWSKYAPDSTAFKKAHRVEAEPMSPDDVKEKKKKKKEKKHPEEALLEKYKEDPMFEEFLQVHGDVKKLHKLKEKENESKETSENYSENETEEQEKKIADDSISDLEYMKLLMKDKNEDNETERKPRQKMEKKPKEVVKLFTLKMKNLPFKIKKKDIKDFLKPNAPYSIRIPRKIPGIAFIGYKTEKSFKKALLKDKSFISGRQIWLTEYVKKFDEEVAQNNQKPSRWKNQEETLKNEEDIAESGRIFVRNLSYTTVENDIEQLFSKYGPLTEVNLPIDTTTRKIKGFGVVTFMMPEHAVKAYSELDGSILHGRMLHLLPGKAKDSPEVNLEESTNFKQKKAAKQKSQAGSSHNWNSLFLGHDAVAEVIADTYGTSKENVVGSDGKGSSAAVRLALGETQIVAQTRKYLEEHGVVLDVFKMVPKSRSKTIILVKNLPSKTEINEIRQVFGKHGEIGQVILPPSGITAIVEFIEPTEARKAFTKLAYSKFKNTPLYLEWAPENTLSGNKNVDPENHKEEQEKEEVEQKETPIEDEVEEEEPEADTTIFVKNLNFQTTDEGLRKHFEGCGKIYYATVATKRDKNNPGGTLSMGYGFVRFMYKKGINKALKTMQQSVLDGKSLELKRSERTLQNDVKTAKKSVKVSKQTGSKILVRNVPFQANKKELFELFSTFGEIKALRLPKKMTQGADAHRGFAFVDYVTASDAKGAFEALGQSTHLYGRRLVLEWATNEEDVDEIRKRTAEHFGSKEEVKSKKSVFSMD